ncbi:MAG: hypothetical protein ACLSHC_15035 [Bilophila wadsworthia]
MLKAEGGGGKRGISLFVKKRTRRCLGTASAMARRPGNPRLYVEKYLEQDRHIEIRVIADQHGNVFAFDNEPAPCSATTRLVEITPSPGGHHAELRRRLALRMLVARWVITPRHGGVPVTPQGEPTIEVNTAFRWNTSKAITASSRRRIATIARSCA